MKIKDKSNILKWVVILFAAVLVIAIASIFIYRAVIETEWYHAKQLEKGFEEEKIRLNEHDQIIYLALDQGDEDWEYFYDVPETIFDDMACYEFDEIDDVDTIRAIWREDCVAVHFKNGARIIFFITEEDEIYWGMSLKIECPSLLRWYKEHKKD